MERTYYTLDDIRKAVGGSYASGEGPYTMYKRYFGSFLNDCLEKAGLELRTWQSEEDEENTCFRDYIWPRFYQEAVIYTDSDENEDFFEKFCKTKIGQIFA